MQGDFPVHCPVAGDVAAAGCEFKLKQAIGQRVGGGDALGGGNGAASRAQIAAQAGAIRGHAAFRVMDSMRGL